MAIHKQDALDYHFGARPGKIEVVLIKPCRTQRDLSLAYTPGVARAMQLIFPDLTSANIAYKLLMRLGGAETIGPILMGMSKPVHVLQRGAEVEEIINIAAIAVVDAQDIEAREARLARPLEPVLVDAT